MNRLRYQLSVLFYLNISIVGWSQTIDKVRLSYDSTQLNSRQTAMSVSGSGQYISFAYKDNTIKIFDIQANKFVTRFQSPTLDFIDIRLSRTGDKIIIIGDTSFQVYDWRKKQVLKSFRLYSHVTKVSYNSKKELIAFGMKDGMVAIYDVGSLEYRLTIHNVGDQVSVLDLNPDGTRVVVGSLNKLKSYSLKVYDLSSGKTIAQSKKALYTAAYFDEGGDRILATGIKVKSPATKIGTGVAYLAGTLVVAATFSLYTVETNDVAKATLGILYGGLGVGIWRSFTSKTFINTLNSSDLTQLTNVTRKGKFAKITYYRQGILEDSIALMMTHTQSFDVFQTDKSKKLFSTTEEKTSFKLSTDYLGFDNLRMYRLGSSSKYLINTYGNNINQIYDLESNSIVGYLFSDSNEDFAVVSRDGRIDGNQNALAKIFWTSKNSSKRTSLESNFEKGFTPKLVNQIVYGTKQSITEFDIDDVNIKVPSLKIDAINGETFHLDSMVLSQKRIKIKVKSVENADEISEVRLYQNGKLIGTKSKSDDQYYEFDTNLTNAAGTKNYFYVSAQSKSGIESTKEKFIINYNGYSDDQPKLYLVTIGINEYRNPKYNLNYAIADANGVEEAIKQNIPSLIKTIVPYSLRDNAALKTNLSAVMQEISSKAREQDLLLFYYAGHGVLSTEGNTGNEFYLIPHDVVQLYGKEDVLREKGVSAGEIRQFSQSINAQKQVFILDACHSGGALESVTARGGNEEKAIAQLARSTGTFWLTSTGSEQLATEFKELGHGMFTYALLEGLNGNADSNKDSKLTIRELSTYVENRVPELSEKFKGILQFPSAYSYGNDFPIALYK